MRRNRKRKEAFQTASEELGGLYITLIQLLVVHKEKLPPLLQSKDLKADLDRFTKKLDPLQHDCCRWHGEIGPKGQHWYVHTVGVTPDCQGQGNGKALMGKLNELADKLDQAMYLEAGERNRPFYEKMGFQVKRRTEKLLDPAAPDEKAEMHLMAREPQST